MKFENRTKLLSDMKDYTNQNSDKIIDFDKMSNNDKEHIYNIAASIIMTRDKILEGGSFVKSVVSNNLTEAITRADGVNIKAIRFYVILMYNYPKI